ncbi:hypothetical protein CEE37_10390 [candidate division LCP-89 bacterium B3_LCP]|uniref:Secretion system C-terminal sorting domain-containing protein n=1 Tax=candidate division LCP-89 bacterium B3_LCP TaxID=2012998 RepID=A0A532UYV1_UNCL8|nr:MAG: hypothetical protein CEE37_10390 [candidate division LCP-89 bacterium B3_LCP]
MHILVKISAMSSKVCFLSSILLFLPLASYAYWPTTIEENLPVAADPDTMEWNPKALPYPDGSTLVVYHKVGFGDCYQIIDRFGQLKYETPQLLFYNISENGLSDVISDDEGGAIISYATNDGVEGIYAQRLDSLGNCLWGDSGVRVFPFFETDRDICTDGMGGFYLAAAPDESALDWSDLWIQRIEGDGSLPWGEEGILLAGLPDVTARYPRITHDSNGGLFVIWEDSRPPYWPEAALFAQHIDSAGNILWLNDLYITEGLVWEHIVISDGEGGFILQTNYGADFNTHWRIDGDGNILWIRDHLSWYFHAKMVPGEPGFFYLGFIYGPGVYGQRMDIAGNNYWPTWGGSDVGALMAISPPDWNHDMQDDYIYQYPYFYGLYDYNPGTSYPIYLCTNALDSAGNRKFSDDLGVILHISEQWWDLNYYSVLPDDEDGIKAVFQKHVGVSTRRDVYAKRCNSDGSLGGPSPITVEVTPVNPPIQIPASGGSFDFDIELSNIAYNQIDYDVWINVLLPDSSLFGPLMGPVSLSMNPGFTIERTRTQNVPAGAPPGTYTYQAWVGVHPTQPWTSDSFTFEKLSSSESGLTIDKWTNSGEDFHENFANTNLIAPDTFHLLSVYPNPFNPITILSFELQVSSLVELKVFDINGRIVAARHASPLSGSGATPTTGFYPSGAHQITFDGTGLSSGIYIYQLTAGGFTSSGKMVLMK